MPLSVRDWFLLLLRLAHALAATFWLGGGVYYLVALRPALRSRPESAREFGAEAQRAFGEWARVATLVMVATGVVLTFDRLSAGRGGLTYAALLALKIVAAAAAFWFAGVRPARRAARRRSGRRVAPEFILALGLLAFLLGVALASVYGRGIAS